MIFNCSDKNDKAVGHKRPNYEAIRKNGGAYIKKRSDGRNITHVVLPKILKHDIRRSYASIFCNAHNSGDASFLRNYLSVFASPLFVFQRSAPTRGNFYSKLFALQHNNESI